MFEGWWAALVVASVWAAGAGGEMARMHRRTSSSVSSSTLEWVDVEPGQPLPPGALQVSEEGGAWCRFSDRGQLAGVVRDGKCYAPFLGNRVSSESKKYEVLVSINGSARLEEMEWSRPAALSPGGLEVSKTRLLALVHTEGAVLPGYVDLQNRRANVLNGDQAENHELAVILTEDEPVSYEMDSVVWDEARAVEIPTDVVLSNLTLENPAAEAKLVSEAEEYTVEEELYWGNVRGTVKGITASITGPSGHVWNDVTWGGVSRFERMEIQQVSLEVPPGAAVNVKLVAVMHKYESPYTGQLTAVYKDGTRRARAVTALHHRLYLAELRADYGHPRSLDDGRKLEGDFPTSEVLIASTTTTTTTTTTPAPPGTDPGPQQAISLATAETSPAPTLPALPSSLLVCCLALLLRFARP